MKITHRGTVTIGARITTVAICPVVVALVVTIASLLFQQRRLRADVDAAIGQQALGEASKVAHSVYLLCAGAESRNQQQLGRHLQIATDLARDAGGLRLASETVSWNAVNQVTGEPMAVTLPKMLLGEQWLGQVSRADAAAPLVDQVKKLTGDFCTVFQRMNEAGDMLRVNTGVIKADGSRAIGTYVAARDKSGAANPIVAAVLRGETYRGRALVVGEWHSAAYQPLWDAEHKRVIGMLYIGIGMNAVNRELQDCIAQMVVGRQGGVWVMGAVGDERGRCLLSGRREQIGQDQLATRDANGAPFAERLLQVGLGTREGELGTAALPRDNGKGARIMSYHAATHFAAWNWIIVASADEVDFADARDNLQAAMRRVVIYVTAIALAVAVIAGVAGFFMSRSIAAPIRTVIRELTSSSGQITGAAAQVASGSQTLSSGSSEQAAAVEQTSASLQELNGASERNAATAGKAAALAGNALGSADRGVTEMERMDTAMRALKASSDDIAKIIKTIDEIAFQTNILALNAAVEAARAGDAGLGFAVVADEVRALAQRSANAAKETARQIETTIERSTEGARISGEVSKHLAAIVTDVRQVNTLIGEVACASGHQRQAVQQISTAVSEMDRVVQRNAATAEEDAAAAEELTQQVGQLRQSVVDLALMIGESARSEAGAPVSSQAQGADLTSDEPFDAPPRSGRPSRRPQLSVAEV